jgi:hypothetical protein
MRLHATSTHSPAPVNASLMNANHSRSCGRNGQQTVEHAQRENGEDRNQQPRRIPVHDWIVHIARAPAAAPAWVAGSMPVSSKTDLATVGAAATIDLHGAQEQFLLSTLQSLNVADGGKLPSYLNGS